MSEAWEPGAPPRDVRQVFEVLVKGKLHQVRRVDSRAPLMLHHDYGTLVYLDGRRCDEDSIEGWRSTGEAVCQQGTWDPSMYSY